MVSLCIMPNIHIIWAVGFPQLYFILRPNKLVYFNVGELAENVSYKTKPIYRGTFVIHVTEGGWFYVDYVLQDSILQIKLNLLCHSTIPVCRLIHNVSLQSMFVSPHQPIPVYILIHNISLQSMFVSPHQPSPPFNLSDLILFDFWCLTPLSTVFHYITATSFSGGGSRRESPTMSKQLVSFITCGCESNAPFL